MIGVEDYVIIETASLNSRKKYAGNYNERLVVFFVVQVSLVLTLKATLKSTTKALIMAAQEQAIESNYIKAKIDKKTVNVKCAEKLRRM